MATAEAGSVGVEFGRGTERSVHLTRIMNGSGQAVHYASLAADHLWTALRYVEQNPVRALLAACPEEYPWSSARAHLTGEREKPQVLDRQFWETFGGVEGWRQMHQTAEDARISHLLRRCTYAGRPFGAAEFVDRMESQFGRKWRRPKLAVLA